MRDGEKLRKHAALLDDMAASLGLDLQEAAITGRMEMADLADAVLKCTSCAHPDKCLRHLAAGRTSIPDYCQNSQVLLDLADK